MTAPPVNDDVVRTRRARLQGWIEEHFGGSQAAFVASTNDGQSQLNQGELSGLLKSKSFGEKRARRLEQQAGMPTGYLDARQGQAMEDKRTTTPTASEPLPFERPGKSGTVIWPFHLVSYERLVSLRRRLGPRRSQEMIREVDKYLDVLVARWEQEEAGGKRRAGGP